MNRKKKGRARCAAPTPRADIAKDKSVIPTPFQKPTQGFTGADTAPIDADFSGVPPGHCHGCGREFHHHEPIIWAGWFTDRNRGICGFGRCCERCLPSLEIIVLREIRGRRQ